MKGVVFIVLISLLTFSRADDDPTSLEYLVLSIARLGEAFIEDMLSPGTPTPIDAYKTVPELIMSRGYQTEIHKVMAEDGYINTAYRITGKIGSKETLTAQKRPPVILQHGLGDDSTTYFANEKDSVLPFLLIEEGYDVWMTNARGNIYSYEHMDIQTHNPKKRNSDYFRFTYDEMAKYDIPSYLDYILDRNEYEKVFYVGASQGTTMFFAAADIIPNLEDKISGFIALSPVMYVGNIVSPYIKLLVNLPLPQIFKFLQEYNLGVWPNYEDGILRFISSHLRRTGARLVQLMFGIHKDIHFNLDRLPVLATHQPGGTSLFNLLHWRQGIVSGEFKMYDFGTPEENREHYGQDTPPFYNTTRIQQTFSKIPSLLFAGTADAFARPKDLEKLMNVLQGTPVEVARVEGYNHVDYGYAVDCREKVMIPSLNFINNNATWG